MSRAYCGHVLSPQLTEQEPEAVVAFDQSTEECHLMSLTPSFIVRIRLYFKDIAKLKVLR